MRLNFHIAIIISILFFPWWATAIILICACFLIDRFYEAVLYGILIDSLFGTKYGFHGLSYVGTAFTALLLLFASFIRNKLVW